jgi:3-hydroxyisobutyrate dehydrogenase-like beta-hydroxyacid dehydrogenase
MTNSKTAAVIGLGTMGTTLARLLLGAGYRVTVWNRTQAKVRPLVSQGAGEAQSAAAAIAEGDIVVVCVHDYKAAREILETTEVEAELKGRVIVQLTTGSPDEARQSERWAQRHGAEYVDGAIQAAPSQMGRPDTMILVSGAQSAYRRTEAVLGVFAGNVKYLGDQVSAASTMDLATLSYVYGASLGFLQGARVAESEGFRVDHYAGLVADISPSFAEFFRHEGTVIQSDDYTVSESPLKISVEATERILTAARDSGLATDLPALAADLFQQAAAAGYGDQEFAAAIKVLRRMAKDQAGPRQAAADPVVEPVSGAVGR